MKKLVTFLIVFNLTATILSAQPGWYVVPGAPVTVRFEDVSLVGNTAWIADGNSGIIYKSLDKGDSWFISSFMPLNSMGLHYYVRSVEFMDDSVGLLGILAINPGSIILFRTSDGGATFSPVLSPAFAGADGICGMAHYGTTFIGVGIYYGQANFFKSTDAGLTWTKTDLSAHALGLVDCYMFNDSTYLISGQGLASQQYSANILRTTDGGVTWQQVVIDSQPFGYCWKMNFLPSGKGVGSIQDSEHIFITSDYGATWNIETVGNCDLNFGGTAFLNDSLGWVGNQYNSCFYATIDGGVQWTPYTFGLAIDRMVVLDSAHVMAVGQTVYKFSFDSMLTNTVTVFPSTKSIHSLTSFPAPANNILNVQAEIDSPTRCSIFLLDENKKVIQQITSSHVRKGKYIYEVNTEKLPAGNYFLYMTTFQRHVSSKVVITH